ncbi:MAG TPA: hypothetical protein VFT17_02155 [Propionibacteriaceae bacterium]|nr:hypothetical protein [Propionibacteriaceae bacterium]
MGKLALDRHLHWPNARRRNVHRDTVLPIRDDLAVTAQRNSVRRHREVGEAALATDVDEQANIASGRCRLGLGQRRRLRSVDGNNQTGAVDVDLQVDPFVWADVRARFVASVRELFA